MTGRMILHIGTHKTGTTTLQRSLANQRSVLGSAGLHYPDYSCIGHSPHYAHIGVANALAGDHPKISSSQAEEYFSIIGSNKDCFRATLLSAEPMYRQVISDQHPTKLSKEEYWAAKDRYIAKVKSLIGDAEIVFVLRPQASFAESLYQEQIKVTRYKGRFTRFVRDYWYLFEYYAQYNAWKKHFAKIHVIYFEAIAGREIAQNFLDSIGLSSFAIQTLPAQNARMSHDSVIFKREMNHCQFSKGNERLIADLILSEAFQRSTELPPRTRSFFSEPAQKTSFEEKFIPANRELAADAGISRPLSLTEHTPQTEYGDTFTDARRAELMSTMFDLLLG